MQSQYGTKGWQNLIFSTVKNIKAIKNWYSFYIEIDCKQFQDEIFKMLN